MAHRGVIPTIPLPDDPPTAGNERDTLIAFLDYFRAVLVRKAAGLTRDQLRERQAPSTLTLGGLVKHLALVEDYWFGEIWLGAAPAEPWASVDWKATPNWDFESAAADEPSELIGALDGAIERSRAAVADAANLDALALNDASGRRVSLRWILVHMIEEYARHCGHADMIRESIDGAVDD